MLIRMSRFRGRPRHERTHPLQSLLGAAEAAQRVRRLPPGLPVTAVALLLAMGSDARDERGEDATRRNSATTPPRSATRQVLVVLLDALEHGAGTPAWPGAAQAAFGHA